MSARSLSFRARSREALQAAASTVLPLWKVTPSRMMKRVVRSSVCSHFSAMEGLNCRFFVDLHQIFAHAGAGERPAVPGGNGVDVAVQPEDGHVDDFFAVDRKSVV